MSKSSSRRGRGVGSQFVEAVESRVFLSASPAHPSVRANLHPLAHSSHVKPQLTVRSGPASNTYRGYGHTPSDMRTVYGFGAGAGQGAGQTVAIVDAFDDPNIAKDLATFDTQFSLPGTNANAAGTTGSVLNFFAKVGQTGSATSLPKGNASWSQEIALDVEWTHAIAPGANILLVEANSANTNDLLAAVDYAKTQASVVSMSWGGSEFSTETTLDSHFVSPAGHPVTFVASAGDTGGVQEWPAESPNVVGVGGTTLSFNNDATYKSETGWVNSGGGTSAVEAKPAFQQGLSYSYRSSPDVGYDADPNSGVAVYDSVRYAGQSGWLVMGGTSAGAPQWSALFAVADQGRAAVGKAALDGASQTLPSLYGQLAGATNGGLPASDFHDVNPTPATTTSGGTSTGPGYDQITGQGTPFNAQTLISDLVNNIA
jgi:subtilase family serine protease